MVKNFLRQVSRRFDDVTFYFCFFRKIKKKTKKSKLAFFFFNTKRLSKATTLNFSDTSSLKFPGSKGSIGHAFTVCIHTENQNQMSFSPFSQLEISVLNELIFGHLRYRLTDVPPQPNSPPDNVISLDQCTRHLKARNWLKEPAPHNWISKKTIKVTVFHCWLLSRIFYTLYVFSQSRTRVKLNRVFFPRWFRQVRSLGCGFAR